MLSRHLPVFLFIGIAIFNSACAHKKVKAARPPRIGETETGIASWYGYPYHGRRAANGEIYDMEKLTAAHRTYPFETWVRVKNLSNDRTVDVRIQDRGPFIRGRIIDLSHAAAREIDLIGPGITKVRLTVIPPPKHIESSAGVNASRPVDIPKPMDNPTAAQAPRPIEPARPVEPTIPTVQTPRELFAIQVGAFKDRNRALALSDEMRQRYGAARIVERVGDVIMYRVLAGEYETIEQAEVVATKLRETGAAGLVVRLDEPR